jgi:methylmalonyl-CoA/ethylmalonyl-CoA epimerase
MQESRGDMERVSSLSHIAIATPDADALAATLTGALGGTRGAEELLDAGTLRVVFVHLGPVTIELLQPLADSHTVARFLRDRGPGLHHVSLEVRDLVAQLAAAKAAGARLIDETPKSGAHGSTVAFLHPKSFGGVLVELCQAKREP